MTALLHRMIDEAAQRDPSAEAIRCDDDSLSYEQLARRANGLGRVLLAEGLEKHQRVAVLLSKGLDVPVAFYGALGAGATLVPIDPRAPAEQVARIVRATGATHLISEPAKSKVVAEAQAECPEVAHVVGVEGEGEGSIRRTAWSAVASEAGDRAVDVDVQDTDPAYVLHTSGSTGVPKLIRHTHHSAMSFVDWAVSEYALTSEDRLSNHSSHHTCFATFDYYAAARVGATTVVLTPAAMMMPASLAALLERERVSVWYSVPTALVHLSLRGDLESRDLSALRWILFAGESFPLKHLDRLRQQLDRARFSHVYGSTEVNVCTYYHLPEGASGELSEPLPIGKACSTARALVVDEKLEPVADGGVGELLIHGSTVMSGYWGDDEASDRALVNVPGGSDEIYYRTGDRVRVLDDGNLTFVARADFQVKIRGHRVELEEVEAALLSIERVEEAAAFAIDDGEGSSSLRAAVVLDGDASDGAETIRPELQKILPPYAVPPRIEVLPGLPRTPTGKVDRKALRAQLSEEVAAHA